MTLGLTLTPGSLPWMMRHELRLSWRYIAGLYGKKKTSMFISLGILGVVMLIGGGLLGFSTRLIPDAMMVKYQMLILVGVDLGLAFLLTMMIASTLSSATIVFYDRGDLDLLLSSPMKPGRILAIRMLAMATNALLGLFSFVAPFVICMAVFGGHWGMLGTLPVMVALALLATAIGVSCAMALFKVLGPRRTRTASQVMGAIIGASVFLTTQMPNIMGVKRRGAYSDMGHWIRGLDIPEWLIWPARAALGDPLPLVTVMAVSIGAFALITWMLGAKFADNAAAVAGAAERSARKAKGPVKAFKAGLMRVMVTKELKLISRDPTLISQVLLQVLYLLPLTFIALRGMSKATDAWAIPLMAASGAAMVTFLSGQIAAGLGWLAISAEEAPELLVCAPVTQKQTGYAKVAATVIPVAALTFLPAVGIGWFSIWAGICTFAGAILCAAAIGFMELWTQKPGKRSEFRMRRKGTGSLLVFFLEFLMAGFIASAVGLTAAGGFWMAGALVPAALAGAILLAMKKDKWLNE